MVERLSKAKESALDFVDMFENRCGLAIWSHRSISAASWGRVIYNTFHATNALSGMTVVEQLRDRSQRLACTFITAALVSTR